MVDCDWTPDQVKCNAIERCLAFFRYYEFNENPTYQQCLEFFRRYDCWHSERRAAMVRQRLKGGPWQN